MEMNKMYVIVKYWTQVVCHRIYSVTLVIGNRKWNKLPLYNQFLGSWQTKQSRQFPTALAVFADVVTVVKQNYC